MLNDLKTVLFDLDGTIIDTEPFHYQCWNDMIKAHGHDMTYEHYLANYAGVAIDQNCEKINQTYQLGSTTGILRRQKEKAMIDLLTMNSLSPMPYVGETIAFLRSLNIDLGLVTSSSGEETDMILNGLGLNNTFACIITRDDVVNKKPHPEPYLKAKAHFNLPAKNLITFEDSLSGIESAKAAGLTCYTIHENILPGSIYHQKSDGVFSSFKEVLGVLLAERHSLQAN